MSLSFSIIWMTTIFGSVPTIPVSTSTSVSLSTTAAVSTETASSVWVIDTSDGTSVTLPLPTTTTTTTPTVTSISRRTIPQALTRSTITTTTTLVETTTMTGLPIISDDGEVSYTILAGSIQQSRPQRPWTTLATSVRDTTTDSSTIRSNASTTSTPSPRLAPRFYKTISTIIDLTAVHPLSKRWELPKGPFTVTVPSGGAPVTVRSSDCSKHCSKHIFEPRQCLRFAKDIPSWGSVSSTKRGPLYESYACLICLNLPAMMETPNHPEGGNSLRETQDLVNAIYDVSAKVNIPPQLAFAIAMQESQASVRPHSGDQGRSRGTFQVQIPGASTCLNTRMDGCTKDQIYAMASLGICGQWACTAPFQRPGIVTHWQQYPTDIGRISRGYNSGSVYDQNDLTAVAFGTNSYSSDISNRMMGRVVGGFYSRTCCAKCDGRRILAVGTCGPVDGLMSDFCGDDRYSFHGQVG